MRPIRFFTFSSHSPSGWLAVSSFSTRPIVVPTTTTISLSLVLLRLLPPTPTTTTTTEDAKDDGLFQQSAYVVVDHLRQFLSHLESLPFPHLRIYLSHTTPHHPHRHHQEDPAVQEKFAHHYDYQCYCCYDDDHPDESQEHGWRLWQRWLQEEEVVLSSFDRSIRRLTDFLSLCLLCRYSVCSSVYPCACACVCPSPRLASPHLPSPRLPACTRMDVLGSLLVVVAARDLSTTTMTDTTTTTTTTADLTTPTDTTTTTTADTTPHHHPSRSSYVVRREPYVEDSEGFVSEDEEDEEDYRLGTWCGVGWGGVCLFLSSCLSLSLSLWCLSLSLSSSLHLHALHFRTYTCSTHLTTPYDRRLPPGADG